MSERTGRAAGVLVGTSARHRVVAGSLYVAVTVVLAGVAAFPIYLDGTFLLMAAVAAVCGAGVAVLGAWRALPVWAIALVLAGVVLVLGVPLAVPTSLGSASSLGQGLLDLAAGTVLGWKDLLTVELPVGDYRNLLVPAFLVFLVGTCTALLLAWRPGRAAAGAVAVGLGMPAFGLLFGASVTSDPLVLGPVTLSAPRELLVGALALVSAVVFLAWRSRDERAAALRLAVRTSGVRMARGSARAGRRRTVTGAAMILGAVLVAAVVVPWGARGLDRDVLRTAVGPDLDIAAEVSPLTAYRSLFTDARADEVLFTVSGDPAALPDRVRVATLDAYDGEVFRAGAEGGASFVRVPSARVVSGAPVTAEVEIGGWRGVWMPTLGDLVSVDFAGERAAALADAFYYSAAAAAGIETAQGGLVEGDSYRLTAVEPADSGLAGALAPGAAASVEVPESLREWVEAHTDGSDGAAFSDGAALVELVELLRSRGYLSHSLADPGDDASWIASLGDDYAFQPSTAGHSLARIDALFTRLLEREGDPRAQESDNFVAAVGDDEQFAVAVALMAGELGFPARVVVGARLSSDDPDLPVCEAGACRGQDLAAWTEVRTAEGEWVAVDVTPQHTRSPSLEVTEQRDPENVTDVVPDRIEEVVPPDPLEQDTANDVDDSADELDLAWLMMTLRVTGIVLLVLLILCGPFAAVLIAKAVRRRGRRRAARPVQRIAGGWEEYLDAAADAGRSIPSSATRTEIAGALATTSGGSLATLADRATFSGEASTEADSERFWSIVEAERTQLRRTGSLWRRVRSALSLRSFLRGTAPGTGGSDPRRTEERGRRTRIARERRTP